MRQAFPQLSASYRCTSLICRSERLRILAIAAKLLQSQGNCRLLRAVPSADNKRLDGKITVSVLQSRLTCFLTCKVEMAQERKKKYKWLLEINEPKAGFLCRKHIVISLKNRIAEESNCVYSTIHSTECTSKFLCL